MTARVSETINLYINSRKGQTPTRTNKYETTTHLEFWKYVRSQVHIRGQSGSPNKRIDWLPEQTDTRRLSKDDGELSSLRKATHKLPRKGTREVGRELKLYLHVWWDQTLFFTVLQTPAIPEAIVAATIIGLTPAEKMVRDEDSGCQDVKIPPVDLYREPVSAPAAILPRVSCFPRAASIEELIALYTRAIGKKGEPGELGGIPRMEKSTRTHNTSRITNKSASSRDRIKNTIDP